jgi:hypothetical protein
MKRKAVVILAMLALLLGSGVPSYAARGGGRGGGVHASGGHISGGRFGGGHFSGGHFGGGHFGGRFHPGFHRGGCCGWWPGAVVGGLALGAALAYPYYAYPYYASPYYAAPYYASPYYPSPYSSYQGYVPATSVEQMPVFDQPSPVQREVVYRHGKYVLYGDGVRQPWQWVWVPAAPPAPVPPPPPQ